MVLQQLKSLLERTEVVFILSIVLPLFFLTPQYDTKLVIEVCLGIVMFFSIRPFLKHRFVLKDKLKEMISFIWLNYILLSGAYIVLAYLFFGTASDFFVGYLLIAIVPPAIAIVPLCYISRCDPESTDASLLISFAASLFIIPIAIYSVFGRSIDLMLLAKVLIVLIIIPMFFAYIARHSNHHLFSYSKAITNLCLGAVVFITTSFNKNVLFDFSRPDMIYVYIISFITIFGLGFGAYFLSRWIYKGHDSVAYSLYASHKNVGTSITLGIFLFNPATAIPAMVALVMQFIYFIVLEEAVLKRLKN